MARITATSRTMELTVQKGGDPKVQAARVAKYHRDAVAEADEQNKRALGAVPPSETFVDGRVGARLETVRLDGGVIRTVYESMTEIVEFVHFHLIQHSPELTGRYKQNHRAFADGREFDPFGKIPFAAEYIFVNTVPYARKIEGVGDRPGQSSQAPDGVYEGVAAIANSRFGNLAWIKFTYRAVDEGGEIASGGTRRSRRAARSARGIASALNVENRFPAIRITMR